MDPFNIIVRRDGKQLGLNIHPKENNGYMVLFEGSLVGEVFLDRQGVVWGALSAKELLNGTHPDYPCDESVNCEGILADRVMIDRIGSEIARVLGLS